MPLAEYHDMIETFAPDRTDQPFSMSILPWRSRRRWPITLHISDNSPLGMEEVIWRSKRLSGGNESGRLQLGQAVEISPLA
jgi:hypothetical protein